ncbi:hypothetical protein WJX64_12950 [Leifsonia sp. YIM 134122]|uniref:Uncharacterized protein n=1 Tax=Leifsonia stereocauli TaxID=3134136 RepID=A0ABU9W630_9MICO
MRIRPIDLVDVLVYLVILGLFVQFFPAVISESFLLSLLTAVLLKVALEVVVALKTRVVARVRAATTLPGRAVAAALLFVVAAGSKFVILWLTDLLFGDAVYLGGFLPVTLLIITLMLARVGVRRLVERPAAT